LLRLTALLASPGRAVKRFLRDPAYRRVLARGPGARPSCGFTNIFDGRILIGEGQQSPDITRLSSNQKLKEAGIAYILQDKSLFPGMIVGENLLMGGYLMEHVAVAQAREAVARVLD
jgi:ABC-type branched-subunit amino acid transport system ATPase component